jgi:hypothetical protein
VILYATAPTVAVVGTAIVEARDTDTPASIWRRYRAHMALAARLAASPHANTFVLKGGLLLAVFDARRSTADADLLARHLANDHDTITNRVKAIAQVVLAVDDGVAYISPRRPSQRQFATTPTTPVCVSP